MRRANCGRRDCSRGKRSSTAAWCRVPRCYPVYALGYRESIGRIESFLDGYRGLSVIGRAGAFKYNNQDHSMLMGIQAAENILARDGHDLWTVNTDFGTYQEPAATRRSA